MIGAIFGDVVGSVYEFYNIKTKEFALFNDCCYFTDDTVMTLAVADALMKYEDIVGDWQRIEHIDEFKKILVERMRSYGREYIDAGYGGSFFKWIISEDPKPYNSYGNGSAMRVSPVAWFARSLEEAMAFAKASAEVTHNHPEGIKGAVATAGATYLARNGADKEEIKDFIGQYYSMDFTLEEIRSTYRFNETCQDTVPQAMQSFFEATSFEDAIRNGVSLGGDSDTLCAICGAVAEAYYGMDYDEQKKALAYLDEALLKTANRFINRYK